MALAILVLLVDELEVMAQLQPTSLPHVFSYTTHFAPARSLYKYNRSCVVSDSLIGIFHAGSNTEIPDTLRLENIYTKQEVDRIVMPLFGDFAVIHGARTGNDILLIPSRYSLNVTGPNAERWRKQHNIKPSALPICYRYNRLSKEMSAYTINTKQFKSAKDYVYFQVEDIGFHSETYSLYLWSPLNDFTLCLNLRNGETTILHTKDPIPAIIRKNIERKPIIRWNEEDVRLRGQSVVLDDDEFAQDTLRFKQLVEHKLVFPNMTVLLLNQDIKADPTVPSRKRPSGASRKATASPASQTPGGTSESKSFPYSQNTFMQWILRYKKERDDLFRGYDIYLRCKAKDRYATNCYLPLGGQGRATKLLADCQEFLDLLDKYPAEVTSFLTSDVSTTRQGFQFDETTIRALLKEY